MVRKVKEIDDVGSLLLCKLDDQLFRRPNRNARETRGYLLMMLFCWHIQGLLHVPAAIRIYVEVASLLRLSVSFSITKFMVVGSAVAAEEKCHFVVACGSIDWVDHFTYYGSLQLVTENGRVYS